MQRLLKKPFRIGRKTRIGLKTLIHIGILAYVSSLVWLAINDSLGADPVKELLHQTGVAALVILMVSLTISPLAQHLPSGDMLRFRRLTGLYAFFVASIHIATYVLFEIQIDLQLLAEDILKRPYITVGFAAFLILSALAATSTMAIRKRMKDKWQKLHNWVYIALILALLHFSWSVKTLLQDPVFYWFFGLILLSHRVWLKKSLKKRQK